MNSKLLTRDDFREGVFARDNHKCVICKRIAIDAHHIIERRLFQNGGYFLDNGASLCEEHHLAAEMTTLSCEDIREMAGIRRVVLPEHFYGDQRYDKWGNPILDNGQRLRGELFHDESVQKILGEGKVLGDFTSRVKYPRTFHLPWSPGLTKDDRVMASLAGLEGENVVATVKLDGENTTMYRDYIHARSLDFNPHPSRDWVKAVWGRIAHDIPEGWRVCGENLFAKHSIHYQNLSDYFLLFSVWNEKNECLSMLETAEWAELLGFKMVPMILERQWDETVFRSLYRPEFQGDECEGYVIRVKRKFHYKEFRNVVGKFVRAEHVQTHGHWMRSRVESNSLSGK